MCKDVAALDEAALGDELTAILRRYLDGLEAANRIKGKDPATPVIPNGASLLMTFCVLDDGSVDEVVCRVFVNNPYEEFLLDTDPTL